MKLYIIILIGLFSLLNVFSQEKYWETSLAITSNQNGDKIFMNSDSTYLLLGELINEGNLIQGFTMQVNSIGEMINYSIINVNDNNIVFAGAVENVNSYNAVFEISNSPELRRIYFTEITDEGELLLSEMTGSENFKCSPRCIEQTDDGKYLIGGYILPENTPPYDWELYLIKVDSLGNVLWEKTYDNEEYYQDNYFLNIHPLDNEEYLLTACINQYAPNTGDIMLMRVDSAGNELWNKVYDFGAQDKASHIVATDDGGYLLNSRLNSDYGSIVKLDSEFEVSYIFDDLFQLCSGSIILPVDNDEYLITGCNNTQTEYGAQMQLTKINGNAEILWNRFYGGLGHDYGYDMIAAPDGGYIISGRTESFAEDTASIYLVKVNCMGLISEPEAQFSFEQSNFTFNFMNESQYVYPDSIDGGHYVWDFGDGNTSEQLNPTHTYPEIGIYGASLTGVVCNDTSTYRQILCVGAEATSTPNFSVSSDDGSLHYFENESILPNNFSLDYAHYTWDFGDGESSTAIHPTHVYTESGSYTATLTYTICEQVYEYSTEINVSTNTELLNEKTKINIYPNPAQDQAIITYDLGEFKSAVLHLYDTQVRLVQVQSLAIGATSTNINLSRLKSGLYVYEVVVDGEQIQSSSIVIK